METKIQRNYVPKFPIPAVGETFCHTHSKSSDTVYLRIDDVKGKILFPNETSLDYIYGVSMHSGNIYRVHTTHCRRVHATCVIPQGIYRHVIVFELSETENR
jgi:hypothetical protein